MACSWLRASAGALPRAAAARLPLPPAERWPHAALAHAPVAAVLLRAGGPAGALGWPGAAARRALSGDANKDVREAKAFLLRLRYAPDVADGIIAALKSSGALLPTLYAMAGNWEVGGDAGLSTLAKAVELELAAKAGTKSVRFFVKVPHARHEFECQGLEGMTLRDVTEHAEGVGAETLSEYIECACSGVMACSTCHVVIEPDHFHMVGPPDEAEQDMLDLAYGCTDTSRLGCQVKLATHMEGMVISIPSQANNLMDHIPFPDQ